MTEQLIETKTKSLTSTTILDELAATIETPATDNNSGSRSIVHDSGAGGFGKQTSHFGELIQGPMWHVRKIVTGLITLPRSDRCAEATFVLNAGPVVRVTPNWKRKSASAARQVLDLADLTTWGGELTVDNDILANGGGGSSTADVIASIRATSNALGLDLADSVIQEMCFSTEGASDPLALLNKSDVVVYGSRCGQIIDRIPGQLPPMVCLGFVSAPEVTIQTASLIGREGYTTSEMQSFARVVSNTRRGIATCRLDLIGTAATESARLNQRRLETRNLEELVRITSEAGALGLSISHSGVAAAAIFDPNINDLIARTECLKSVLLELGCAEPQRFDVNFVPPRS